MITTQTYEFPFCPLIIVVCDGDSYFATYAEDYVKAIAKYGSGSPERWASSCGMMRELGARHAAGLARVLTAKDPSTPDWNWYDQSMTEAFDAMREVEPIDRCRFRSNWPGVETARA